MSDKTFKAFYDTGDPNDFCKGKMFMEETAIAELLRDDALFANSRDYYFEGKKSGHTLVLFVNCSDTFAWGCSDAEDVSYEELENLYSLHIQNPRWGSTKWCCIKRNQQPQKPVREKMQKEGIWDEILEKLPENRYDKYCKEKYAKQNQLT